MRRLAWTFAARIDDKYQIRLTRSICTMKNGETLRAAIHALNTSGSEDKSILKGDPLTVRTLRGPKCLLMALTYFCIFLNLDICRTTQKIAGFGKKLRDIFPLWYCLLRTSVSLYDSLIYANVYGCLRNYEIFYIVIMSYFVKVSLINLFDIHLKPKKHYMEFLIKI